MNIHSHFLGILLLSALSVPSAAWAGDLLFSYDNDTNTPSSWGTKKRETYDVAISISGDKFPATSLKGMEIPVNGAERMTDVKVWLSSKLPDNRNTYDIFSSPIDMESQYDSVARTITYTLPEAYTITRGETLYVGYSFSLSALNAGAREPLAVAPGGAEETFVRTQSLSSQGNWTDLGRTQSLTSCMKVTLGNATDHAAAFASEVPERMVSGKENNPSFQIVNHGAAGIKAIGYKGSFGEKEFSGTAQLDHSLTNLYGSMASVNIPLPALEDNSLHHLTLTLTHIDGQPNAEESVVKGEVALYDFIPFKRPLMEEYTAASCGYCPKGTAGIDLMKEMKGEDFIALSFHTWNDPLTFFDSFPMGDALSLPTSQLDRTVTVDPYLGRNSDSFGLDKCWEQQAAVFTIAHVDVSGNMEGSEIGLDAEVTFIEPVEHDRYRVEFFVLGDGLTKPEWTQKNYFSNNDDCRAMIGLDKYAELPNIIKGIVYDDVVLAWEGFDKRYSLSDMKEYRPVTSSCRLTLPSRAPEATGYRGVAAVIDNETGQVMNAAQCRIATAGIEEIGNIPVIVSTLYLDLQGRTLKQPEGLCIRLETYSDGTVRASKQLR